MGDVTVPEEAIRRYKRFKSRADDLRAAYQNLGRERVELQDQLGKLSAAFAMASRGRQFIVASDGQVYEQHWHDRGNVRSREWHGERRPVEDKALAHIAADTARVNGALAEIAQRQQELSAQLAVLDELASRCRAELRRRGWNESGRYEPGFIPYSQHGPGPAAA
jgi:chromosome segregation ATPase